MAKSTKKNVTRSISQIQAYNRKRNLTEMKNLSIAGSVATEIMKANKPITAKVANEKIGGVSRAQFAWALKKGESRGYFNRFYNKKLRRFEYILNNEKF